MKRLAAEKTHSEPIPQTNNSADPSIRNKIREICHERPGYGYPRVTAVLNRSLLQDGGNKVNKKRVYRIMREEQLLLRRFGTKPTRTHDGKVITLKSNTRFSSDIFHINCWNGDLVKVAFAIDCCDREVIGMTATEGSMTGEEIRNLMLHTVEKRFDGKIPEGHLIQWLSDNGPQYTARKTIAFGRELGFLVCTAPAYCPESNGIAEAFVKRFKHDYVYVSSLQDAKSVIAALEKWFEDYNENAPHSGLNMMSPREFRQSREAA
jgi:transposase InsO family protein